jgi:hypothetical protein
MRRIFQKSRCKCPRCVAKRRIQFLTVFGSCIAAAAGCYVVVHHSDPGAPPSFNPQKTPAEEPTPDVNVTLGRKAQPLFIAATQLRAIWKEQDNKNAQESQTVQPSDEPKSHSKGDVQRVPQPNGEKVAAIAAQSSPEPANSELPIHFSQEPGVNKNSAEAVKAEPSDPYGLLSQWFTESRRTAQGKSEETSLDGNELRVRNHEPAESQMPGRQAEPPSGEKSDVAPSSVAQSIADPSFAGPTVNVSPAPSSGEVVAAKEADSAIQAIPDEALAHVNGPGVQAQQNGIKEPEAKPVGTAAGLVAVLGNNPSGEVPAQEPSKPRGYITIKSEAEPQNQGAEDHPPKPRDHPLQTKNHPSNVEDYPSRALGQPEKPQDQPPSVRDYLSNTQDRPSKPPNTSQDLRRFASSFLQADQTGNIAEQHRFFADSVHFYHEGDLSWAGVAAATRRYHQERQNRRYGAEGTATVKGPVNGGFYVVEQPVSWSRSDGSRVTRGRSVLRLRVVPTDRNGWKITSIEEIGQP